MIGAESQFMVVIHSQAGDIAQVVIKDIFKGMKVTCYIDDVGFWSNGSYEDHLKVVDEMLRRLAENGLKTNPLKCEWAVENTDFLGFDMTPEDRKYLIEDALNDLNLGKFGGRRLSVTDDEMRKLMKVSTYSPR